MAKEKVLVFGEEAEKTFQYLKHLGIPHDIEMFNKDPRCDYMVICQKVKIRPTTGCVDYRYITDFIRPYLKHCKNRVVYTRYPTVPGLTGVGKYYYERGYHHFYFPEFTQSLDEEKGLMPIVTLPMGDGLSELQMQMHQRFFGHVKFMAVDIKQAELTLLFLEAYKAMQSIFFTTFREACASKDIHYPTALTQLMYLGEKLNILTSHGGEGMAIQDKRNAAILQSLVTTMRNKQCIGALLFEAVTALNDSYNVE